MIKILQYSVEPIMAERDGKLVVSSGACTFEEGVTTTVLPEDDKEEEEEAPIEMTDPDEAEDVSDSAAAWHHGGWTTSLGYATGVSVFVSLIDGGFAAASVAGLAAWSMPLAMAQEDVACEQGNLCCLLFIQSFISRVRAYNASLSPSQKKCAN
jgi:hypothetical protein